MFASLHYISEHHANADIPGQQYHGPRGKEYEPKPRITNGVTHEDDDQAPPTGEQDEEEKPADTPEEFEAALKELARDLVGKQKQIEEIVKTIPGQDRTREEQEQCMQELNAELEAMDVELVKAAEDKQQLLERVESAIWKVNRY